MYYLMNKDNVVLTFLPDESTKSSLSEDVSFTVVRQEGQTPYGFDDITSWIDRRKASKHNAHLKKIMQNLKCNDNEGFINLTHAVGINDTFWVKSDKENIMWENVSLFRNQFSDIVSKLAFEGTGLYDEAFSSTSPELSCDGSFRKCFRRERTKGEFGSNIFLYKRGGELGKGLEPYCEVLASEIAQIVSPTSVSYDLQMLHGKLASRCNIFTNEKVGYASYAKMNEKRTYTFQNAADYFAKIGYEQMFREMLTIDSLCFNQDRHSGNYGVLFDNDTLQIIGMSPIFDLNLSMLPYVEMSEFANIGDKLYEYAPKLGNDFTRIGQIAMNDSIRERLKDIKDFSFSFRGDDRFSEERVKCLEMIVRKQAASILSNEVLQTKDVFFSQKAADFEKKMQKAEKAASLVDKFADELDERLFVSNGFISVCKGTSEAQILFENESYLLTADFLNGKFCVTQNAQRIPIKKLKEESLDFYKDVKAIEKQLYSFVKKEKCHAFAKHFESSGRGNTD